MSPEEHMLIQRVVRENSVTPDELHAIADGNMALFSGEAPNVWYNEPYHSTATILINLNVSRSARKTPLLIGQRAVLYPGRADQVMIDKMLGLW